MTQGLRSDAPAEPSAWRRVAEHFTLVTLGLTVTLYAIGQIQQFAYLGVFSIPGSVQERDWISHVFMGAVSIINLTGNLMDHPGRETVAWMAPVVLSGILLWVFRKASGWARPAMLPALNATLGFGMAFTYVWAALAIGTQWGRANAQLVRTPRPNGPHYVLTPEGQTQLPVAFRNANEQRSLRFVASGTDTHFLFDPSTGITFALPTRLVVCREFASKP